MAGFVTYVVDQADSFLSGAAQTQFGGVASSVGTIFALSCTLLIAVVFLNMALQLRPMDGSQAFWLVFKLLLVNILAFDWNAFNSVAGALLDGLDRISGALISAAGGNPPGASGTYAEEFDNVLNQLSEYLNVVASYMGLAGRVAVYLLGIALLALLGFLAAAVLLASKLLITFMISLAPIMIFLTLFEPTKEYFTRWLSATISFAMMPLFIAGIFSAIFGITRALLTNLGDPSSTTSIGAVLPFFMMVLLSGAFIGSVPLLIKAVSGNVVMPTMSMGGNAFKNFAQGARGGELSERRQHFGQASAAEKAGALARQAATSETAKAIPEKLSRMMNRANRID